MDQKHSSFRAERVETACVIVAGGSGLRCGGNLPKQYCELGGEPVLAHTVRFFAEHALIDHIVVVVASDMIEVAGGIISGVVTEKPVDIVAGGARRQDSVFAGLRQVAQASRVLVHDGARPFPPGNIAEALALMDVAGPSSGLPCGLVFGSPATDSIKRVKEDVIRETIPRDQVWAVQTPQIFPTRALIEALERCDSDGAEVTDDASAFEHMGWPVRVVPGSRYNIKITYAEDFIVAEALLQARQGMGR